MEARALPESKIDITNDYEPPIGFMLALLAGSNLIRTTEVYLDSKLDYKTNVRCYLICKRKMSLIDYINLIGYKTYIIYISKENIAPEIQHHGKL